MPKRASGILLHISSLPSNFGIGDFGSEAYKFIDFLEQANQHYWQVLPINPTDSISEHSPYSSSSAFAGNILFISPELLLNDGFVRSDDVKADSLFSDECVDYNLVSKYKTELCNCAYNNFVNDPKIQKIFKDEFTKFVVDNSYWIEDYALFFTIKSEYNGAIWTDWVEPLKRRNKNTIDEFTQKNRKAIDQVKFHQFLFFKQWNQLKAYCNSKDILLIGDVSIYVNFDSADVWAHPKHYKLCDQFQPIVVAGVPPDYFSESGQRWGNPIYNWDALKHDGFSWWIERFRLNFKLFDIVRVDHFRGLVQCWEIPANENSAIHGKWVDVPTNELFNTLEGNFKKPLPIIAEDLGYITDDVREVMGRFNLPGMKVLLFAFNESMNDHPYLPHNYNERCVVYTGTHDNNTVLGWFQNDATKNEIENIQEYLKKNVSKDNICWELITVAMNSIAETVIIPMPDVLELNCDARMNKPATTNGNWCWRLSRSMINTHVMQKLSSLTTQSKRN